MARGRLGLGVAFALVVLAACAPGAFANPIVVNSNADTQADTGTCTLREAIVAANTNAASGATGGECAAGSGLEADDITFAASPFDGSLPGAQINVLGTTNGPLPDITQDLAIDGGDCGTSQKPCVGIEVTEGPALGLRATGSADLDVQGLAITAASTGILTPDADDVTIEDSWFGIDLSQTGGAANANTIGIAPDDGVQIGGDTAGERNLIANNSVGVQITGGDDNTITGNYFSTSDTGTFITDTANTTNIAIGNGSGGADPATGNVIGGADAGTPGVCDGLCNLIVHSGGGQGIALFVIGEGPATGPTTIAGNFIGLGLDGTSSGFGNGAEGIHAAGAPNVTVGGATTAHRNYVANNIGFGLDSNSSNLDALNNYFGLNAAGTAAIPNNTAGPATEFRQNASNGTVTNNRFGEGSVLMFGDNASFQGNTIGVGTGGQDLGGDSTSLTVGGNSNTIGGSGAGQGNTIGNQTILAGSIGAVNLTGDSNTLQGNLIGVDSTGAAQSNASNGIQIGQGDGDSDNNIIGGLGAGEANTISNSGGGGIVIGIGNDSDFNTFRGNVGRNNGGLFIDLGSFGQGNLDSGFPPTPNEGIQAPTVTSATSTQIMGTSTLPDGSIIDVYRTFTVDGDIKDFQNSTTVTSGNWSVTYPSALPDGTCVTAIQSNTSTPPSSSEAAPALTIGGGACDVTAPTATISSGPGENSSTNDTTPEFGFTASEAGSSFECSLDGGAFSGCPNPFETPTLSEDDHTLQVRATDPVGNTGPPSAIRNFEVDTTPPTTIINSGPSGLTNDSTPTFTFSANEANSSFECSIDSTTTFSGCSSGFTATVSDGAHTFRVRATDPATNLGPTVSRSFTVDTAAPQTNITRFIKRPRKRRAKVVFSSNDPNASFECKLNAKPFLPCSSPKVYRKLKLGRKHRIQVRAKDAAGNVDATPTSNRIRIPRRRR